jgi:hypothetical protein
MTLSGPCPPRPVFEYGWSPPFTVTIDGVERQAQALILEDKEKLRLYILMLEENCEK